MAKRVRVCRTSPRLSKRVLDAEYNRTRRDPRLLAIYGTSRWQSFRSGIRRERVLCEACCSVGLVREGRDLHHVRDPRDFPGGTFDPRNVRLLCHRCHMRCHSLSRAGGVG